MQMVERIEELERRRARVREMGGAAKVERQHERGKLTCRERLALLFDDGAYVEVGMHGTQMPGGHGERLVPADGVVCGWGKVSGRNVACAAYDFTVKGGSIGLVGETKVTRMREIALKSRMPMVWLIDSAGARIDASMASGALGGGGGGKGADAAGDMVSVFANSGYLFREQIVMSGVVPQVAAMMGPGAAGTAYIPGLADFVPMVKKVGSMALAGPPLVKAVTGEDVDEQDLGGSRVHTRESGVGCMEVKDDPACIEAIKAYLSYMPSSSRERPPVIPCDDPIDRREEDLLTLVPESTRKAFDMYDVIERIVDHGAIFDIKGKWAKNLITCFARLGGYPVGIVANQPKSLGGVIDIDASDKAAHFIDLCDAFNVPLLFLHDVPGFMVGTKMEKAGIIRHGAKFLHVMASATVPKLSVVVRKSYGAGYYAMCGRAYEPDALFAWPGAEISVMGAEGMVGIGARALTKRGMELDPEVAKQMAGMIQPFIDVHRVAAWGYVDDVIDPRDTRGHLCRAIELAWGKEIERPDRKHGVRPV